jgi:folylpolyglutamate synthase/dihydropteroate synthase
MVVIDGAHNAYSMQMLVEAIKEFFQYEKCFIIFGTSRGKDIPGMAQELKSLNARQVILTKSSHPRAASTSILAAEFAKLDIETKLAGNVFETLTQTLTIANHEDLILVTGSLFIVAEAIDCLTKTARPSAEN